MTSVLEFLLLLWLDIVVTMDFLYRMARDKKGPPCV